jgi:hypothetical protein
VPARALKNLEMRTCKLGSKGGIAMSRSLAGLTRLEMIDLVDNQFKLAAWASFKFVVGNVRWAQKSTVHTRM